MDYRKIFEQATATPATAPEKTPEEEAADSVADVMSEVPAPAAPAVAPTPEDAAPTPDAAITPEKAEEIAATGELTAGSSPRAIKSFEDFMGEAKKTWIKDVPMEKGALRKEMKKGKGEKITKADIMKKEASLKKKDKDKKKPGLQLSKKDAKTHKRDVLALNLMKASGAISESRQDRIKGAKDDLVKIHAIIEKMINQTARKNKGI